MGPIMIQCWQRWEVSTKRLIRCFLQHVARSLLILPLQERNIGHCWSRVTKAMWINRAGFSNHWPWTNMQQVFGNCLSGGCGRFRVHFREFEIGCSMKRLARDDSFCNHWFYFTISEDQRLVWTKSNQSICRTWNELLMNLSPSSQCYPLKFYFFITCILVIVILWNFTCPLFHQ